QHEVAGRRGGLLALARRFDRRCRTPFGRYFGYAVRCSVFVRDNCAGRGSQREAPTRIARWKRPPKRGKSAGPKEGRPMITEIRVLPPLVIGRLGSSPEPLENYDLELPKDTIGFRKIVPAETLYIGSDGSISRASVPSKIVFRDGDRIRPVAP